VLPLLRLQPNEAVGRSASGSGFCCGLDMIGAEMSHCSNPGEADDFGNEDWILIGEEILV